MASRFWASSEDVSTESVDSSASVEHGARDALNSEDPGGQELGQENGIQNPNRAVIPHSITASSAGLSALQPYQRANLFYLALIEGRCRTQAVAAVNAGRHTEDQLGEDHPEVASLSRHMFDEVRRELAKAGMLSEDFVTGDLPQSHSYLNSFDNILDNIATQKTHSLSEQHTATVANDPRLLVLDSDTSVSITTALIPRQLAQQHRKDTNNSEVPIFGTDASFFNPSSTLVPQGFFVTPDNFSMVLTKSFQTLLRHIFPNEDHSKEVSTVSNYATDYAPVSKLGSGGFGSVHKVRNKYDQAEYAVKKIVVKRETIQRLYDQNRIGELCSLIKEVQTLAKLQHHNIVAYHHCWMEPRPLDDNVSSSGSSSSDGESEEAMGNASVASLSLASLSITNEHELNHDMRVQRRRNTSIVSAEVAAGIDIGRFCFENDSFEESKDSNIGSKNDQDDDDEDTEEIERLDGQIVRSPKKNLKHAEFDLLLYIKMAAYPLSLDQYIGTCNEDSFKKSQPVLNIQHCFHVEPSVRLLLSMLDGIEYIHRKNIIHRDLKPANILIQILDPSEVPTQGFVNISECKSCTNIKPTWISPRIGDFGLIHDLAAPAPPPATEEPSRKRGGGTEESRAPGTATYLPIGLRKSSPVCAKLDVYSLGIMAFEMSYKFGTSTERFLVLDRMKRFGDVPNGFENHALKDCILNMVKEDVKTRWDCTKVREHLEVVLKQL